MKKIILGLACLTLSACASIIEGRSQQITVNTNPSGAACTLARNGLPIGTVAATPGSAYIEKTKHDMMITCKKEGFEDATYLNHSGAAGATVGNIVAGGLIGWGIDSATGSDNKYDSPVNITMVRKVEPATAMQPVIDPPKVVAKVSKPHK